MSVAKVIELIAESDQGWEEAVQDAVTHASHTIRNIRNVWVKDMQGIVENNQIVKYRANVMISFMVEEGAHHE